MGSHCRHYVGTIIFLILPLISKLGTAQTVLVRNGSLNGHSEEVNALEFIDDSLLVSIAEDSTMIIWDVNQHVPVKRTKYTQPLREMAIRKGRLMLTDGTFVIGYLIDQSSAVRPLSTTYPYNVSSLSISSDGSLASYVRGRTELCVVRTGNGEDVWSLGVGWSCCWFVLDPVDYRAAYSLDSYTRIVDLNSRRQVWNEKDIGTRAAVFSPDGEILVSAGESMTFRWATTGELLGTVKVNDPVKVVRFGPSGDHVFTGGENGWINVWDTNKRIPLDSLQVPFASIRALAISPSGNMIAVGGGHDGTIHLLTYVDRNDRAVSDRPPEHIPIRGRPVPDVDTIPLPKPIAEQPNGVAVVIGNRDYLHIDVNHYASNDARRMTMLLQSMGFREENTLEVINASKANFDAIFGTADNPRGKLSARILPGITDVFVYISSKGGPDPNDTTRQKRYLLPVDYEPNYTSQTGVDIDELFFRLSKLQARSVSVIIDACYVGGINISGVRMFITDPALLIPNGVVLTASTRNEAASWIPQGNHSMLTYFILLAVHNRAAADTNGDRMLTYGELFRFVSDPIFGIPFSSGVEGIIQHPTLEGDSTRPFLKY